MFAVRHFHSVLLALAIWAWALPAPAQWTPVSNVPMGGWTAIAVDPVTPSTIYAASGYSLYKSLDGGVTWSFAMAGLDNGVNAIAINPSNPSTIFVAIGAEGYVDGGIYRSNDGGATWAPTAQRGTYNEFVALDPINPSIVYAGTAFLGTLIKSTDGGASWRSIANGLPTNYKGYPQSIWTFAVSPSASGTIYVGSYDSQNNAGIYRSTDGGQNWAQILVQPARARGLSALAIDPSDSAKLYVAATGASGPIAVLKSTDGGASWSQPSPLPNGSKAVAMMVDPGNPAVIIVSTDFGSFRSNDRGASWTGLGVVPNVSAPLAGAADGSAIYLADFTHFWRSTDHGATWNNPPPVMPDADVTALAIDPSAPATLYAGHHGETTGILKSIDGGQSWADSSTGLPSTNVFQIVVSPSQHQVVYATTAAGLAKSIDQGAHWSATSGPSTRFAVDPTTPNTLYALSSGIAKSIDGGANWTNASLPSGPGSAYGGSLDTDDIAIDPGTPSRLYATVSGNIYRSTDGGASWALASISGKAIAVSASQPATVYAADRYVYKSSDSGATWTKLSVDFSTSLTSSFVTSLAVDHGNPAVVYAVVRCCNNQSTFTVLDAGVDGVFKSVDGGATWFPFSRGVRNFRMILLDPTNTGRAYALRSSIFYYSDIVRADLTTPPWIQSGWWWNPNEPGRGYSIELRPDGHAFMAAYMYRDDGTAVWYAGSGTQSDNSIAFALSEYQGAETLSSGPGSSQPIAPSITATLTATRPDAANLKFYGTGSTPSQSTAIVRYPFPQSAGPVAITLNDAPQTGWYWNPSEAGTGYFIEAQANQIFLAGFLYGADRSDRWYVAQGGANDSASTFAQGGSMSLSAMVNEYGHGQSLDSGPRVPTVSAQWGNANLTFTAPGAAQLVLPDGRGVALQRFTQF